MVAAWFKRHVERCVWQTRSIVFGDATECVNLGVVRTEGLCPAFGDHLTINRNHAADGGIRFGETLCSRCDFASETYVLKIDFILLHSSPQGMVNR